MLDEAQKEANFDLKQTTETEMDKEWRQIQENQSKGEQRKGGPDFASTFNNQA